MKRSDILYEISRLHDKHCKRCTIQFPSETEKKNYCHNQCDIGKQFIEYGDMLLEEVKERRKKKEVESVELTKEQVIEALKSGKSKRQIAEEAGIKEATLYYHIRKWGIQPEKKQKKSKPDQPKGMDQKQSDIINHPEHYTTGGIEVIDIMKAKMTPEQFEGYLLGNILKYTMRYRHKNGLEDIKKSRWYINKLIEVKEQG